MAKYINTSEFAHTQGDKVGVLITNLGTPEAPEPGALRRYLKEFLSDPRVVEVPRLIWWLVLNLVILRIRPARSAKAYAKVWTDEGSPLMLYTRRQAQKLALALAKEHGDSLVVDFAMRYGNPAIGDVIDNMLSRGVRKLVVLPLYPQYSATTTASTFDAVAKDFSKRRWLPELRFVSHYHDYPGYIQAVANKIRAHWQAHGRADKLVLSYHGVPMRYLKNGDPYHCECHKTSRLVAQALGLSEQDYLTTFQSRFGREEWLKPYTDHSLQALAGQGVRSVQVVCPGFSADCLETIEEIDMENRDYFIQAGGERFEYIPCLNDDDDHIQLLKTLVVENIHGWLPVSADEKRAARAMAMGAKR